MRKRRNSDGTMRRNDRPRRLTNRSLIARWVEAETLYLKRLGMSYQMIAEHLMAVARGHRAAFVPVSAETRFPAAYSISLQAVHRAFKRAIVRQPNAEAAELRQLDNERLEELYLALQPGIRKGDPRSIEVSVKVLTHKAEINGYKTPAGGDTQVNVLVQNQAATDVQALADLTRLTLKELREYRRLESKACGGADVIEIEMGSTSPKDTGALANLDPDDPEGE